jgi:hypothetical protein
MEFREPSLLKLRDRIPLVDWYYLSLNPATIPLLEKNLNKVSWFGLSRNPAIFNYDYQKIKEKNREINKEVCEWYWHPNRMDNWQWQED